MAVGSAQFPPVYSSRERDDSKAARVVRFRSITDPEKYSVYLTSGRGARRPTRLGLAASREPLPAALRPDLSPEDAFSATFSGFALRHAREEAASAASPLCRAHRLADVRVSERAGIYDIAEDLAADAWALQDRLHRSCWSSECRHDAPATAAGEVDLGSARQSIRRAASERRPPSADNGADDDYGFLHYCKSNAISEIMPKESSSSSGPSKRFFGKKHRNSKSTSRQPSISGTIWCYEGKGRWMNDAGVKLMLDELVSTLNMSDKEYGILQKICLIRLQSMEIGCSVTIPKGDTKRKRFGLKKKRSNTINLGHLLEHLKEGTRKDKEELPQSSGWVFAIPLSRALANDVILRRRRSSLLKEMSDSGNICSQSCHGTDPSAESSQNSLLEESKEENASSRDLQASIIVGESADKEALLPHRPVIPNFVTTCFRYIEKYGLHVLGIFRVCSSKMRIKQLHDEFDSGKEVTLDDEHNPHDVAALLKEYFRELPEPLLCKELYDPFLATRAINDPQKRLTALRYVVSLLPAPNRDLLYSLLMFLVNVHNHSSDTCDGRGNVLSGNKMDSFNLATLFGPNVLRKMKTSNDIDQLDFAEKTRDVIHVVKEMIDNYESLFSVPIELQDEVLKTLMETDPDSANFILTYKLEGKEETRGEASSVHSSCSNLAAACHHASDTGLSKSASSPAPFLHGSSNGPPYRTTVSSGPAKDGSAFDMGNYVELRSPRLTVTVPQPLDSPSTDGETNTPPFYVPSSLPSSPQMYNSSRSPGQLGPWVAFPASPKAKGSGNGRQARDSEPQLSRYPISAAARPGGTGSRRESAPSSTSKQRPLSVMRAADSDGKAETYDGQETLV